MEHTHHQRRTIKKRKAILSSREDGQSLVEMAVIVPFLMILVVAIFEMSLAFAAYIALINAAREGASFASLYPQLEDPAVTPASSDLYRTYQERARGEAVAMGLNQDLVSVQRPVAVGPPYLANCPITATVGYELSTFTSNITLPLVGRFGLPNTYWISYSIQMPIREAEAMGCGP